MNDYPISEWIGVRMSDTNITASSADNTEKFSTDSAVPADRNPSLVNMTARVVMVLAIGLSLYQLYTAGIAALTAMVQRSIHLGAILSLTFLLKPAYSKARKDKFNIWLFIDWALVLTAVYCTAYICYNLTAIFERQGDWLTSDIIVSIMGTFLVLEACRRVIGWIMTGICLTGVLYAMYGPYMPELIIHKGIQRRAHRHHLVADHRRHLRPSHWRSGHLCFCFCFVWGHPGNHRGRRLFY